MDKREISREAHRLVRRLGHSDWSHPTTKELVQLATQFITKLNAKPKTTPKRTIVQQASRGIRPGVPRHIAQTTVRSRARGLAGFDVLEKHHPGGLTEMDGFDGLGEEGES